MKIKNRPEIIVFFGLSVFGISLFMEEQKLQASMQIASQCVTGYYAYLVQPKEDKNYPNNDNNYDEIL